MEEEYNITVKWAQEDVETSYNLLNKNNKTGCRYKFEYTYDETLHTTDTR